jgi:hypothetical protein
VLERLRGELRKRGYASIVFNFDKPETKDFTDTVRLLAGLSKFVIADITNPKSSPLELHATVPESWFHSADRRWTGWSRRCRRGRKAVVLS